MEEKQYIQKGVSAWDIRIGEETACLDHIQSEKIEYSSDGSYRVTLISQFAPSGFENFIKSTGEKKMRAIKRSFVFELKPTDSVVREDGVWEEEEYEIDYILCKFYSAGTEFIGEYNIKFGTSGIFECKD